MEVITNFMRDGGIPIAAVLLVIAVVASLVKPLINIVTNFEESKKALLGIVGLVVVFLIGYALSNGELTENMLKLPVEDQPSASLLKLIGAGINTALIATVIMVVYLVVDLLMGIVRN